MENMDLTKSIYVNNTTNKIKLLNNIYNVNDESNIFYNMFKIANYIKSNRFDKLFNVTNNSSNKYKVVLYIYKEISLNNYYSHILIENVHLSKSDSIIINFDFSQLKEESIFDEKNNFTSNIIEEIFSSNSESIEYFELITDKYDNASNYLTSILSKSIDQGLKYFKADLLMFNKANIDNLLINCNKLHELSIGINLLNTIEIYNIGNIFSKFNNNCSLHDNEFDKKLNLFVILDRNIITCNNILNNKKLTKTDNLDISLSLLKVNKFNNEEIFTKKNAIDLTKEIILNILPMFLEINFIEIYKVTKSSLDYNLFKHVKISYTKSLFAFINSILFSLKYNTCLNNIINSNSKSNYIKKNHLEVYNFEMYKQNILKKSLEYYLDSKNTLNYEDKFLQIKIDLENPKLSYLIFNLYQDFKSILIRKLKYDDIYKQFVIKPDSNSKNNYIEFQISIYKNDINSISKILNKIKGNNLIYLKDGKVISIGGYFKHMFQEKQILMPFNSIIVFNKHKTKLKIFNFKDNEYLTNYYASVFYNYNNDNNIELISSGGSSSTELIVNFVETPIYKIILSKNLKEISCERIDNIENCSDRNSLIFKHNSKLSSDGSYILLYGGFKSNSISKGLNVLNTNENKNYVSDLIVKANIDQEIYNFVNKKWCLYKSLSN